MIERVTYTPEAEQDVADAYSWYEAREPGLGEDFLRCVEACVTHHPTASRALSGGSGRVPPGACPAIPVRGVL